ncbi:MAG TPA: hypothetical protein H9954_07915 [Candidatus Phascolarctobacterium stercoravium]|nr:hypothetical protein [Candidatus Phascolarctobacterium stercoravium]
MKEELISKIEKFSEIYNLFERQWLGYLDKQNIKRVNFKRIRVKDLDLRSPSGVELLDYISHYRRYIARINPSSVSILLEVENIKRTRVKEALSINQKISKYIKIEKMAKDKNVAFYVLRCLNDIFGARIIIEVIEDFDKMVKELAIRFPDLRIVNASKNTGYKAIHIYTKPQSGSLPWELQIWQSCDEGNNTELHTIYKRDYIEQIKVMQEVID